MQGLGLGCEAIGNGFPAYSQQLLDVLQTYSLLSIVVFATDDDALHDDRQV